MRVYVFLLARRQLLRAIRQLADMISMVLVEDMEDNPPHEWITAVGERLGHGKEGSMKMKSVGQSRRVESGPSQSNSNSDRQSRI